MKKRLAAGMHRTFGDAGCDERGASGDLHKGYTIPKTIDFA